MPVPTARIAWYVTGRFYEDTGGGLFDLGYFLHLAGVEAPLFTDPASPGEATALLTFKAAPFGSRPVTNGNLSIGLDPAGTFELYFQPQAGARFEDPDSFARGERIATFRRVGMAMGETLAAPAPGGLALSLNVFSAEIVHAKPFQIGGRVYDLREILPHGITQWGVAAANPLPPQPPYPKVVAFTGSAIAGGRAV